MVKDEITRQRNSLHLLFTFIKKPIRNPISAFDADMGVKSVRPYADGRHLATSMLRCRIENCLHKPSFMSLISK